MGVFEIELPPLRERMEDLPILIETILKRLGKGSVVFDESALTCLRNYPFPGNVRELRNIVERAVLLADDGVVHAVHLPRQCQQTSEVRPDGEIVSLKEAEHRYLQQALRHYSGSRKDLAAVLGIGERVLYRKLAEMRSM
ncbi:MAG: hypothetical protein O3A63_11290 [Proteobacteria bacterium]|nr:hypothetical protein [Pseudomonadota bacterium]